MASLRDNRDNRDKANTSIEKVVIFHRVYALVAVVAEGEVVADGVRP